MWTKYTEEWSIQSDNKTVLPPDCQEIYDRTCWRLRIHKFVDCGHDFCYIIWRGIKNEYHWRISKMAGNMTYKMRIDE